MMRRLLMMGVIAVGLLTVRIWWDSSVALARPGIVHTTDGRNIEGDVNDDDVASVSVSVRGGTSVIQRDKIDHIDFTGNVDAEYKQRAAKLAKESDAPGHIALARWCFDNKQYDLAKQELDIALRIAPDSAEANTLYATVQSQQRLARGAQNRSETPAPPAGMSKTGPATGPRATEHKYLTAEDINEIRQKEMGSEDSNVHIRIEPEVRKKFLESEGVSLADFNALSPVQQARMILKKDKAELSKGVIISTDPAAIAGFKRNVQPVIVNTCATVACHGGPNGGNFFLYPQTDNNEASYTNYYLLQSYTANDAKGQKRLMIDRMYPGQSLLLQYGLAGDQAAAPHPEVPKGTPWHGVFRGGDDLKYQNISQWMGGSLKKFEPKYDINFSLAGPATKPAP